MSDESKIARPAQQDEDVEAHGRLDESKAAEKMGVTEDESDEVEAHKFTDKTADKVEDKMV
jgi:hypothetical protein